MVPVFYGHCHSAIANVLLLSTTIIIKIKQKAQLEYVINRVMLRHPTLADGLYNHNRSPNNTLIQV